MIPAGTRVSVLTSTARIRGILAEPTEHAPTEDVHLQSGEKIPAAEARVVIINAGRSAAA